MKLLVSRYINQNKKYIYNLIKEDIKNKKTVYLIVPEQFTLGKNIESFDYLDFDATINVKVKSFKNIVNEIIDYTGGRALNFISDSSKFIIIQIVLLEIKDELRMFQKNIYDKSFIDLLVDFITEMSSNNIEIEHLEDIVNDDKLSNDLKLKLKDIIKIMKRYSELKAKSDFVNEDRVNLAIRNINKMHYFNDVSFYFDKFNDMSDQELNIIKEIDKISDSTLMNLIVDENLINKNLSQIDDAEIFDLSLNFYNKIKTKINDIEIINIEVQDKKTEIEELTDNMFSYNLRKVKENFKNKKLNNIYINRSNNTNEEIENLNISIKKDIIKNNLSYKDIAILTTNSSEYYEKIKRSFELNDIPYFIDEPRNLIDNPMIKFIKSSINLLNSGLMPINITQFLKSSFIKFDDYELNLFNSYIQRRKIFGKMIFEDKYFSINPNQTRYIDEDIKNLESIVKIRNIFLQIIENIDIKVLFDNSYTASIKEYTQLIYEFISNDLLIEPFINNDLGYKEEQNEENRLIWNSFIETLDSLYNISDISDISFGRFSEILVSAIDNFKIGILPPSQDQIIIGDIKRSRFNQIKKLYVLGMSNLYYPVPNEAVDIFLENEKEELIENDIPIKNTISKIYSNDLISFYTLLNTSKSDIVFSYSLVDSSNSTMENASILNWVKAMIPEENIEISENDYYDNIYTKTMIASYLPDKLNEIKKGEKIDKKEKDFINNLLYQIKDNETKYKNIFNAIRLVDKDYKRDNLSGEIVNKIYNTDKFSVSQLEEYNSNPYYHFIKYGLKPREFDTFDISFLNIGNLTHEVLSRYIKYKFEGKDVDYDQIYDESVVELFENFKTDDSKNKFFINQMKDNTKAYSHIIMEQNKNLDIANMYFEQRYGKNSIFPAIEINLDDKTIQIEGKIDRIDEFIINDKKYYRVIDYKTGNKEFNISKIYYGIDLQLLLYLRSTLAKDSNSHPIGAFYQKLNTKLSYDLLTKDDNMVIPDKIKLDGIINKDESIFSSIDDTPNVINNTRNSNIYKFYGNANKLAKRRNAIDEEMFYKLFKQNEKLIKESIINILEGDISLRPFKLNNFSPYDFNHYNTIDKGEDLKYIYLDKLDWDYVFDRLNGDNDE